MELALYILVIIPKVNIKQAVFILILLSMLQKRKLETRSMYRSVRYRINRDQQTRTADPSTCNFRIKRNSVLEATMAQTIDSGFHPKPSTVDINDFMRTDYLKTFNSLMSCTQRIKAREKVQRKKQASFFEDSRVVLPSFEETQKQVQQSQHSLLTPILKSFNNVKIICLQSQNQLKQQRSICEQIKFGLKFIRQSKTKQLNDIQKLGKDHFDNIRAVLRKNQITQQQKKLKTKRQLQQLEEDHQANRKLFTNLDGKSSGLQLTIFNSTPYNVKQRDDETGQIYI